MTAEQLQDTIRQAVEAAQANYTPPTPQAQDTPPAAQPASPFGNFNISDDDLIDGRTVKALAENYEQRIGQLSQGMQHLYGGQVGTYEALSRQQNPDIWEKWGKEIKEYIEKAKQSQVVTPETYDTAVAVVRGKHVDEIAQERVNQLMQNAPPGDLTGGIPTGDTASTVETDIPESWKRLFDNAGLTLKDVQKMVEHRRDYYGEQDASIEKFVKQMQSGEVVQDMHTFKSFDLIPAGGKKESR